MTNDRRAAKDVAAASSIPPDKVATIDQSLPTRVELARRWLAERRARDRHFGKDADLFADPAWDILLDLYVNDGQRGISIKSACGAAHVPSTTAHRWLCQLEQRGLVCRCVNELDHRSWLVALTERGFNLMNHVLDSTLVHLVT